MGNRDLTYSTCRVSNERCHLDHTLKLVFVEKDSFYYTQAQNARRLQAQSRRYAAAMPLPTSSHYRHKAGARVLIPYGRTC